MKIENHLSVEQKKKLKDKTKNQLTERDIKDLMGINRDTYKKVNGAWRRK